MEPQVIHRNGIPVQCNTCKYAVESGWRYKCHRYPPTLQVENSKGYTEFTFAPVPGNEWCGEWQAKPSLNSKPIDKVDETANKLLRGHLDTVGAALRKISPKNSSKSETESDT